jgi:hypothetical protein
MRIWDIPVEYLCRQHLLGEHGELHALWNILTTGKGGYQHHPETLRWKNSLLWLYIRHCQQVEEMKRRGWNHKSPIPRSQFFSEKPTPLLHTLEQQREILRGKGCDCKIDDPDLLEYIKEWEIRGWEVERNRFFIISNKQPAPGISWEDYL